MAKPKENATATAEAKVDRVINHIMPEDFKPQKTGGLASNGPREDYVDCEYEVLDVRHKTSGSWGNILITPEDRVAADYWFKLEDVAALDDSPFVQGEDGRYGLAEDLVVTWTQSEPEAPHFRPRK